MNSELAELEKIANLLPLGKTLRTCWGIEED